jgi:hypothetical protein
MSSGPIYFCSGDGGACNEKPVGWLVADGERTWETMCSAHASFVIEELAAKLRENWTLEPFDGQAKD